MIKDLREDKLFLLLKYIIVVILFLIWTNIIVSIISLFGININKLPSIIKVLIQFISDFSFVIFILFIYRKDIIRDFKNFFSKKIFDNIELALKYWIVGATVMYLSNIVISFFVTSSMPTNESMVRNLVINHPIFMVFVLSIYAPITEELIFRKGIRDLCNNKYLYIIGSGLIFSFVHVISSLTSAVNILFIIPYLSFGIAFGALYYKSNNIFSTMIVHSIHNIISLIIVLYLGGM